MFFFFEKLLFPFSDRWHWLLFTFDLLLRNDEHHLIEFHAFFLAFDSFEYDYLITLSEWYVLYVLHEAISVICSFNMRYNGKIEEMWKVDDWNGSTVQCSLQCEWSESTALESHLNENKLVFWWLEVRKKRNFASKCKNRS